MDKNKLIRHCALWHEGCGVARTKVLFREGGHNPPEGAESVAYWMDREVYNMLPIGEVHTLADYEKLGKVDPALDTDIYSNR
jgi:hypothetical protein